MNHHLFERLHRKATPESTSKKQKFSEKTLLRAFLIEKLPNLIKLFKNVFVFSDRFDRPRWMFSLHAIWKLYIALKAKSNVEGILTNAEKKRAFSLLYTDYNGAIKTLPKLKIDNVQDSVYHRKVSKTIRLHLKNSDLTADVSKVITQDFLKVLLAQLSVGMWYDKKKKCEKSQKGLLQIATVSNKVGLQIYKDLKWVDLARILLLYSAKGYAKSLGVNHKFVAVAFQNLALVSYETGTLDKAVKYIKKSIEINKKHQTGGNVDFDLADNLNLLAKLYEKQDLPKVAEKMK